MIIVEAVNLMPYLNYILDKDMVINASRKSCTAVKEALNKNHMDASQNTINFMNDLSEDDLRTTKINDRITMITWAKKLVGKHHHIDIVQAKIDIMHYKVKVFKGSFVSLFQKGFPSFWEEYGRLFSQVEYQALLVKCRLDHKKFEDMNQSLLEKNVVDKLAVDFEIINTFRVACS